MQASLGAGLVQCHMPDAPVPGGHAFAAHIFPHRCAPHMQAWISMDNVDDVANGLLFIKPLKVGSSNFHAGTSLLLTRPTVAKVANR